MLKNTQSKIISIICITQIILITLVGVASYKATNKANIYSSWNTSNNNNRNVYI